MRRLISAFTVLALALALSACSGAAEPLAELRGRLLSSESVSITAAVGSTAGGAERQYTLALTRQGGECAVSVLAPESLAGVRAVYDAEGRALEYEGLLLPAGEAGAGPVDALPLLLEALESGYVSLSWSEGESTLCSLELTDSLSVTLSLGPDGEVQWAELYEHGECAARCVIESFEAY